MVKKNFVGDENCKGTQKDRKINMKNLYEDDLSVDFTDLY